ncbi:hypothetical protein LINPERPRIM_LOCUS6073, partial [Linum perenne]
QFFKISWRFGGCSFSAAVRRDCFRNFVLVFFDFVLYLGSPAFVGCVIEFLLQFPAMASGSADERSPSPARSVPT